MYYHDGGELLAEDVDQYMEILQEVVTPTQEVTIGDIQVGDPDIPRTDDHEKLRQVICRSCHLLIGNVAPYHLQRVEHFVI